MSENKLILPALTTKALRKALSQEDAVLDRMRYERANALSAGDFVSAGKYSNVIESMSKAYDVMREELRRRGVDV